MNISSWTIELTAWLANTGTYIFPYLTAGKSTQPGKHKTAIVIISPGFTGPMLYRYIKKYLEKLGFFVIVLNFSKEMKDLETAAPKLEKYIEEIKGYDICLIGISSAGLVAHEYLNSFNGWRRVKYFIAMATPFKGTYMSYFTVYSKAGRQLIPTSNYIKKMQSIEFKNKKNTFCMVAKKDQLVPRESSVIKDIVTIEVPVIGHVRLHAFSKDAYSRIAKIALGD